MVVISVYIYIYGVKIITKLRWESGFLWWSSIEPPPPPLCTNGSAGYLMQLSVNHYSTAMTGTVRAENSNTNTQLRLNLNSLLRISSIEIFTKSYMSQILST